MVGLVVVSHSRELAEALAGLVTEMGGAGVPIAAVGGTAERGLGAEPVAISGAIARCDDGDGVVVLCDLGSSVLSARAALERERVAGVCIADAPLVEGAIAAAVVASTGADLAEVVSAATKARGAGKL